MTTKTVIPTIGILQSSLKIPILMQAIVKRVFKHHYAARTFV